VKDHLEILYIAQELHVSLSQARTLRALNQIPVMDYRVVEVLDLYPRSKMRKNVLEPLVEGGWVVLHSLTPMNSDSGAPRLAWSIREEQQLRLKNVCESAVDWASRQLRMGTLAGQQLKDEVGY
jgi:hypothetical protein